VIARAWLKERKGRKFFVTATVKAGDTDLASASGLFLTVEPHQFLEHLAVAD
jgi:hypothetical protein